MMSGMSPLTWFTSVSSNSRSRATNSRSERNRAFSMADEMFTVLSELLDRRREQSPPARSLVSGVEEYADAQREIQDGQTAYDSQPMRVPEQHDQEERRGQRAETEEEQRGQRENEQPCQMQALALELAHEQLDAAVKHRDEGAAQPPQRPGQTRFGAGSRRARRLVL